MAQSVVVLPATATALGVVAMWTPEQRAFLMDGPRPTPRALVLLGGAAHLLVQWRRHREEMLAACPAGRRPWGFWAIEKRFKIVPLGDIAQARAIRTLGIYRDDAEKALVHRRLDAVMQHRRMVREALRVA
jgi:hypothetical protein